MAKRKATGKPVDAGNAGVRYLRSLCEGEREDGIVAD
jgi:hypothetical protein